MNRLKSILLGGLLASVSIAAFSQNAHAAELNFQPDHLNKNVVAFDHDHDRLIRERELRERQARELRERQAREFRERQAREFRERQAREFRERQARELRERQARELRERQAHRFDH